MNRTVPAAAVLALMALAACAPKVEKTVAAIDPTTSAVPAATGRGMAEPRTVDGMLARARERFATAAPGSAARGWVRGVDPAA